MNGDRITRALAQIEAAACRIEAAEGNRASVAPANSAPAGNPELEAKYAHLRKEADSALAEIDLVIAELER